MLKKHLDKAPAEAKEKIAAAREDPQGTGAEGRADDGTGAARSRRAPPPWSGPPRPR